MFWEIPRVYIWTSSPQLPPQKDTLHHFPVSWERKVNSARADQWEAPLPNFQPMAFQTEKVKVTGRVQKKNECSIGLTYV